MSTKRFIAKHGLDNNNQTITNVANPINGSDAVNKNVSDVIYDRANTAYIYASSTANNAYDTANNAWNQANSAYNKANSVYTETSKLANSAYDRANTAYSQANDSYIFASSTANNAYITANNAWNASNTANTWLQANDGITLIAAKDYANSNDSITLASAKANDYNTLIAAHANDSSTLASAKSYTDTIVSVVSLTANLAWDQANTAYSQANNSYIYASSTANNAYITANNAWNASNTANTWLQANDGITLASAKANDYNTLIAAYANDSSTLASSKFYTDSANNWLQDNDVITLAIAKNYANLIYTYTSSIANDAYNTANSAWADANVGISIAQAAYDSANNVAPQIAPAHQKANAAYATANNAWAGANASYTFASSTANNAYNTANNAWAGANASYTFASSTANNAYITANNAWDGANASHQKANAAYSTANSAWATANASYTFASSTANNAYITANNAWAGANNSYTFASSTANNAYNTANNAWATANSKLNSSGGIISGSLSVTGNVQIDGTLSVSGNVFSIQANNLSITDNMIYLNRGANTANPDIGITAGYNDGIYHHTGFFRDATDGIWKVFDNYAPEPDESVYIDTSNNTFRIANFQANTIYGNTFITSAIDGIAPFVVSSTTLVSNLNVDYLDNSHGSYYSGLSNTAFDRANTAYSQANASYTFASSTANNAYNTANSAWAGANASYTFASSTANNAYITANNAWNAANTANTYRGNATNLSSGTIPGDRGVTAGSTTPSFIEYNGTTKTAGQFDGGSTAPTNTTRLNYDGNLYATTFYGEGTGLTGTASNLTANVANFEVITNATSGLYYPQLVSATSGNLAGFANNKLVFNIGTNALGVGVTSPAYPIDAIGQYGIIQLKASLSTGASGGILWNGVGRIAVFGLESSSGGVLFTGSSGNSAVFGTSTGGGPIELYTNNSKKFIVDTSGNVGIGIGSPSYKLDVNGTAKANTLALTANTASTNTTTGTLIVTGGAGVSGNVYATTFFGAGTGLTGTASNLTANVANFEVITNATSGTYYPQLVSDTNGNLAGFANNALAFDAGTGSLGIGMVPLGGPLSGGALQVYASSTKNYGTFDCETAGWGYLTFSSGSNIYGYIGPDVNTIGEMGVASVGDLVFSTDYVERLRINSSGNVGIGTTQANTKLHVNGTILSDKFDSIQFYLNDYGNISTANVGTASISNTYINYSNNTSAFGTVYGSVILSRGSSSNTSYMYSYGGVNRTIVKGTTTNARFEGYGAVNQANRGQTSDDISTNMSALYGSINTANVERYANSSIVTTNLYGSYDQVIARVGSSTNSFGTVSSGQYGIAANYSFALTNHYGFYASGAVGATSGTGTAVVTNYYGLYLATPTVQSTGSITNRWGVYQQDSSALNYFAGTVGIGVTPVSTSGNSLEIVASSGKKDHIISHGSGLGIVSNAYYAGSAWKYISTNQAAYYFQVDGAHVFYTAPTGSAGSNVSFLQAMTISQTGNVSIGTASTVYKLDVNGTAKANTLALTANTASTNTTTGTLIVTGGVGISGALNATTKSFDIQHPSDPNKRLRYGSLESPYHGVRLTGKGKVINGKGVVTLPYYFRDLVHEEDVNIQLTNIKHGKVLWVEDINIKENRFTVGIDETTSIFTKEYEFFWDITAERKDVPSLIVEE